MTNDGPNDLCAECGVCCNGWLYTGVELTPGEAQRLLHTDGGQPVDLPFPCAFHDGAACLCYDQRPNRCRNYRCETRSSWMDGTLPPEVAFRRVRAARAAIAAVEQAVTVHQWAQPGETPLAAYRRFLKDTSQAQDQAVWRRRWAHVVLSVSACLARIRAVVGTDASGRNETGGAATP